MAKITKKHCEKCDKDITKNNWSRHIKSKEHLAPTTKKNDGKQGKEKKKREKSSQNFFLTFQKIQKYKIQKVWNRWTFREQLAVGNEWGVGGLNGHTHAFVKTSEKMTFAEFKLRWLTNNFPKYQDIQSCRNVGNTIRYISKEYHTPIIDKIDMDLLSLPCKAKIAAKKYYYLKKIPKEIYPYCNLAPHQKKSFLEIYESYAEQFREDDRIMEYENTELQKWQKNAIYQLKLQNDRQILWIYDRDGGAGKTFLTKYLNARNGAAVYQNANSKDIGYAYTGEKMVTFNYTREDEERVNYSILENLKDGYVFSPKYDSQTKHFKAPKIICMANFLPDKAKMSSDRWTIFELKKQLNNNYKMFINAFSGVSHL